MSDSQNWNARGEQMKSALSDALRTGNFAVLNELVSQTVTDALNDAGKQFTDNLFSQQEKAKAEDPYKNRVKAQQQQQEQKRKEHEERHKLYMQQQKEAQMRRSASQQALKQRKTQANPPSSRRQQTTALISAKFKQVGSASSVLYRVFGGIGFGISSLIAFFRLFAAFAGNTTIAGWVINFLFIGGFFYMIRHGVSQKNRLTRAKRYVQLCGGRMYRQIESLARDTGRSVRFVTRDLHKMLNLGMFPEGHLDEKKTCFMLNDSIYQQYLETENARIAREQAQSRKEEISAKQQTAAGRNFDGSGVPNSSGQMDSSQESELNTMITEGMECIRKLRELNDRIPGEVISEKLYRLENLLKDIFDSVREHPEQMHRMHKMMDYYLPTTLKLVEAYEDFDKVSMPGPDILSAKAEIERTLDIINQAFSELLGNLFQDAVLDATTDAQVLQTMLAREGLTGNTDFLVGNQMSRENNKQEENK